MTAPPTITEVAPQVRAGQLSPVDVLDGCLARIDRHEDRVRAWAYLDRGGAREQAERLAAELKRGEYRGPLHGIPVGVKDIIDVFDLPTGCGSKRWATSYARRDATVVERLRQAGAIILGKTVTTAYASFDPPPTRNPWDAARTPGGSSSGSAAAVACGMCFGALASQTGGSITRPASYCGVASLKPTYGRVSVDGVMPLAPSMDHVGVMANSVRDLAVLFQVIAGPDNRDPKSHWQPIPDAVSYIDRRLDPANPEHAPRYAWMRGFFEDEAGPEMRAAMQGLASELTAPDLRRIHDFPGYGTPVLRVVPPASFAEIHTHHRTIMAVEAAAYHGERMARHPDDYPPRIRELIEYGLKRTAVEREEAHQAQVCDVEIDEMTRSGVYILTPATPGPAPSAETTGNPVMNLPWSFTGSPTVSVPIAWSADGLPLSVQITGSHRHEGWLLSAAAWCERLVGFDRREVPG